MWNFMKNVSPPPAKKPKKTKEELLTTQRTYDKEQRVRGFLESWRTGRPWIKVIENGSMVCDICQQAVQVDKRLGSRNSFVEGCQSFKLESIKKHESSVNHLSAENLVKNRSASATNCSAPAQKALLQLNKSVTQKLGYLFRTCHALAKNNRPFTDYVWQCRLDDKKGVDVGKTYQTAEYAKVFTKSIADTERQKLKSLIDNVSYISVLSDGATDASRSEQELFYVRICEEGTPSVHFMGIQSPEAGNSSSILKAMQDSVELVGVDWSLFLSKLVGLGCDGASMMTGHVGGLYGLLKSKQPAVTLVHCFAHRLELAFKDCVKAVPIHEKAVTTLLMGLYYFYYKSPLNRSMLKKSAMVLGNKLLMPTRVSGTRWVGHLHRALSNMLESYQAIMQHLQQMTDTGVSKSNTQSAKAKCFLKLLKSRDVMLYCHLLIDVTGVLKTLSTQMQETISAAGDIHVYLKTAVASIKKYKTSEGPALRKLSGENELKGIALTGNCSAFTSARQKLLDGLEASLKSRFPETKNAGVVNSSLVLKFQHWPVIDPSSPETLEKSVEEFGDKEIHNLCDHYSSILQERGFTPLQIETEWMSLKSRIYSDVDSLKVHMLNWPALNIKYRELQGILSLVDLLLTLPASSAEVERGFSQLKRLKTDMRCKLKESRLNDLMTIKMLSPDISSFDPEEAIDLWNKSGSRARRPLFREAEKKQRSTGVAAVVGPCQSVEESNQSSEPQQDEESLQVEPSAGPSQEALDDEIVEQRNLVSASYQSSDSDSGLDSGMESDTNEKAVDRLVLKYM